jgi:hypothetical protein
MPAPPPIKTTHNTLTPPKPQVKVDSVRVSQGSAVVYLKLLDDSGLVVPVHIGEVCARYRAAGGAVVAAAASCLRCLLFCGRVVCFVSLVPPSSQQQTSINNYQYKPTKTKQNKQKAESNALLREINRQRQARPLTHDVAKTMLQAVGCRVTKVRTHSGGGVDARCVVCCVVWRFGGRALKKSWNRNGLFRPSTNAAMIINHHQS